MKIYITHEICDYGLSDMANSRAFTTLEAAEAYSNKMYVLRGYGLDIMEIDVES